jgi:hypothetical protein
MNSRKLVRATVMLMLAIASPEVAGADDEKSAASAAPSAKVENAKIEALISHIDGLSDASFIRNDKSYDARSAAKFLRGKWQAQAKEIHSATEFIDKAATLSSTTGKPYLIRMKNGNEVTCASYLKSELKKLEAGGGA